MVYNVDEGDHDQHDFTVKRGVTESDITETITDADDNPVDLSDATVRFVATPVGRDVVIEDEATIDDAEGGEVSYSWSEDDLEYAGSYNAEFHVDVNADSQTDFESDIVYPHDRYLSIWVMDTLLSE